MEFNQVLGNRRSIRFYDPDRQVKPEQIQEILEAANRSSRSVQGDYCKAVVVYRKDIDDATREALKTPTTTVQFDLAPVAIFWYGTGDYEKTAVERLTELVDIGALPVTHGWSPEYVETVAYAQVVKALASDHDLNLWMISVEAGLQLANAMLSAVNQGLGVCLSAFNTGVAKKLLDIPDDLIPMWVMFVGYPAEDPLTHGQRPRRPLEQNYFQGKFGTPFKVDPAVTERLKKEGLIQPEGKKRDPARTAEIRKLAERFGLPL
jgi:nitroreductase